MLAPAVALGADQGLPRTNKLTPDPGAPHYAKPGYQPAFFTAAEWAFVCAAVDRLIPRDETGPGALELGVAEYIDRALQSPYGEASRWYMHGPFLKAAPEFGYQSKLTPREQYRLGVRGVNAYTQKTYGKAFAELSPTDKDATLKAMEDGKAKAGDSDLKAFFASFLLKNTVEGYFCDPMYGGNKDMAAWKMIGYPGVRGDYIDFADKNAPYPFGPVDLHGRDPPGRGA
jgi:gluconate 2-dehydrogenase gamma chain